MWLVLSEIISTEVSIEVKVLRCSEEQYKRQDCHTLLLTNSTIQNFIATIYFHQKWFINIEELFNSAQGTSSHFTDEMNQC